MTTRSFKSVIRNALEATRVDLTKDAIATRVTRHYFNMRLDEEVDAQHKPVLKTVSAANTKNNEQNFWRYVERTSVEAKATIMDLLPAILAAMPKSRAVKALNDFLNPLGFSVAVIGESHCTVNRDRLLAHHEREVSEAKIALLQLNESASLDDLRDAYREVQEARGAHDPLLDYLESLMTKKRNAA